MVHPGVQAVRISSNSHFAATGEVLKAVVTTTASCGHRTIGRGHFTLAAPTLGVVIRCGGLSARRGLLLLLSSVGLQAAGRLGGGQTVRLVGGCRGLAARGGEGLVVVEAGHLLLVALGHLHEQLR